MNTQDFLENFEARDFPSEHGRWHAFGDFDPPFKGGELSRMERNGLIEVEWSASRFRLTLKAAQWREAATLIRGVA